MRFFHPFMIPVLAVISWWAMLIALLACWGAQGHPIYWFMDQDDSIVYLSDVGATNLRPLFIACAGFQGLLLVISFAMEAYLRKSKRLIGYFGTKRPFYDMICAICSVLISELGLLVCSIWEVSHYKKAHYAGVVVFIIALFVSSCFLLDEQFCVAKLYGARILAHAENFQQQQHQQMQQQPQKNELTSLDTVTFAPIEEKRRNYIYIGASIKIGWLLLCSCLAIAFGVLMKMSINRPSAVLEWVLCFFYGGFHLIFAYDFLPVSSSWGFYLQNNYNHNFDKFVIPHQSETVFEV